MLAYERLIEAVEYGYEEETNWWEYFDTLAEAKRTLNQASKYIPSDHEAAQLASAMEEVPLDDTGLNTVAIYDRYIDELRKQLRRR